MTLVCSLWDGLVRPDETLSCGVIRYCHVEEWEKPASDRSSTPTNNPTKTLQRANFKLHVTTRKWATSTQNCLEMRAVALRRAALTTRAAAKPLLKQEGIYGGPSAIYLLCGRPRCDNGRRVTQRPRQHHPHGSDGPPIVPRHLTCSGQARCALNASA